MTRGQKQTDGRNAFMVLALLILGGLIFAAGITVGRRLMQCPKTASADPLKELDTISARSPVDSRALSFPQALNGPRSKPLRRPEGGDTSDGGVRSPTADQKEKSAPTDSEKSSFAANTAGRYCMQVASYHERAQAQALLEKLLKRGYPAVRVIEGTASEKGIVYRVRVGHFISREDAERQKEKIVREENLSVLIVTEE